MQAEPTTRLAHLTKAACPVARTVRCPFHYERTPGCALMPSGWFRCFGCGAAGWWTRQDEDYARLTRDEEATCAPIL